MGHRFWNGGSTLKTFKNETVKLNCLAVLFYLSFFLQRVIIATTNNEKVNKSLTVM